MEDVDVVYLGHVYLNPSRLKTSTKAFQVHRNVYAMHCLGITNIVGLDSNRTMDAVGRNTMDALPNADWS